MKELFEQANKTMEQTWDMWRQMVANAPAWQQPETDFMDKWSAWVETARSTYEVNMSTWKVFLEQSEQSFFEMFKKSPMYNEAMEAQLREAWDGLKKAQEQQEEMVKAQLQRMEDMLKKGKE